jgi:hypothetical protein
MLIDVTEEVKTMASEKMINEVLPAYRALTESDKRFVEGLMQGIMLARESPEGHRSPEDKKKAS